MKNTLFEKLLGMTFEDIADEVEFHDGDPMLGILCATELDLTNEEMEKIMSNISGNRLFDEKGGTNELGQKVYKDLSCRLGDFFDQWSCAGVDASDLSYMALCAVENKNVQGRLTLHVRSIKRKKIDKA
tara:strand:- start:48941 stop:49327 length:387 start_codon:yes stop_codon:yes gene_type:complete